MTSAPDDVQRLLAYEEIRRLASRYAVAMDARDFDTLVGLFVEDYRHWNGDIGRDVLRDEFERAFRGALGGRVGFTQVGTHAIDLIDADHATGTVYCVAELGDQDRWIRQAIAYQDTYERRDGGWYFVNRDHQLFYGVELERSPLRQPPAEWPKSAVGVGTLPYGWDTWRTFHGEHGT
jgi:hypothetical protein